MGYNGKIETGTAAAASEPGLWIPPGEYEMKGEAGESDHGYAMAR
jgi:hypothetical protein